MRKTAALLLVLVFLAATFLTGAKPVSGDALVEDSWITVAPLRVTPEPYSAALGAVAVNGKIYFIGDGICERYDPDTNAWTAVTPPPIHNAWGAVAACQNKIYIIGGVAEHPTQVYDPATGTWENRTSPPGTTFAHQATVVGDKIYVISGGQYAMYGILATSAANHVYDTATDSWSEMTSIPTPVACYASAVLDDKIYIIGGGTGTFEPKNATNLVQIFDPETNQWSTGKTIPSGVYKAAACSTSGLIAPKRIYVVGGSLAYDGGGLSASATAQTVTNITQVYDLATGRWSSASSIPESRISFWLVNVNDALYAVGGKKSDSFQATEKYIPIGYDESLLPTPSPSPTPTASPTPAPDGYAANLPIILILVVVIVVITIAGLAVYHKKFKKNEGFFRYSAGTVVLCGDYGPIV
jgi:N-acetylneuraminic acid mutarotase